MKQSIDREPFVPSEKTLEKLRRALRGDYDTVETPTTDTTAPLENQTKERKDQ